MAAEQLDIWAQAEAELGAMDKGQDQEGRLKAYLLHELDFSYGPGHVAAINPVWDQSELERLLTEFNQVPPAGGKCVCGGKPASPRIAGSCFSHLPEGK